jgi:predicted nucleotidyltransferase
MLYAFEGLKPMQKQKSLRGFRDRDFIRTEEGFFFCVVGPYHPQDRAIAYVKYVPARSGKWRDKGTHYQRVMHAYTIPNLLETFNALKARHPQYLFHSEFYDITMTAVPHDCIAQHYKPEEKLAQILHIVRKDALQEKLTAFTVLLHEKSGIALDCFGVTGSILLDIHNPKFSDIDLTIYGLQGSLKLKRALEQLVGDPHSMVRRFKGEIFDEWCRKKTENFPLSLDDASRLYERKWNIGSFSGVPFSIHPVKLEDELAEKYGDKTYRSEGQVVISAEVADDRESMFLPCVYGVRNVKVLEGKQDGSRISEVVSYESLYDSLAETGEEIVARGKVESVCDNRDGKEYYRVLIGSPDGRGKEYIKPIQ